MKQFLLAFPLALFPLAAAAEDAAMLAQYWTDSGSVSPEYAWEATVTILEDGSLSLKYCTGYSTEGPDCRTRSAKVSDDQLEAIRAAALESGLKDTPAKELSDDMIPIGGSATGGRVVVDGQEVDPVLQVEVRARAWWLLQQDEGSNEGAADGNMETQ